MRHSGLTVIDIPRETAHEMKAYCHARGIRIGRTVAAVLVNFLEKEYRKDPALKKVVKYIVENAKSVTKPRGTEK